MSLEDFKTLSEVLQAVVISLATIAAGVWAIYQFKRLRRIAKTKAELVQIEADIQKAGAELDAIRQSLRERSTLKTKLECKGLSIDGAYLIEVGVHIENVGTGTEVIELEDDAVRAIRLENVSGEEIVFGKSGFLGRRPTSVNSIEIAPGDSSVESFLVPVPCPGIYSVEFTATCSTYEAAIARSERQRVGVQERGKPVWHAHAFVRVGAP